LMFVLTVCTAAYDAALKQSHRRGRYKGSCGR
jgi:hypothetical protein